jgi:hypothetical protein
MKVTKGIPRAMSASGIQHPQDGQKCKPHFAAYGFVDGVSEVFGQLRDKDGKPHEGVQIHPPSDDTGFWVIHFVRDDLKSGVDDVYDLEVYDADDLESGPLPDQSVSGLTFEPLPTGVHIELGKVSVTYPQDDTPVNSEFAAYGTAPGNFDVTGKCSNCSYQITQGASGNNWVLYCLVSTTDPPVDCGITVSQQNANPGTGSFEIPRP